MQASSIEELTARISQLEEENANLKLLKAAVRRNNSLFEALLSSIAEGITLTGPDRRIVRVVKGLTGFTPRDLTGVLIDSLVVPEDHNAIRDAYDLLLRRHCQKVHAEVRVPRADGVVARFSMTLTDMLDDPNVQCIVLTYIDLSG
jgi:PAS domain S-box-containing protein